MEIVKKNLFPIICGVIALLAFVTWIWPVGGWYSDFQETLDKRVNVDKQIRALQTKERKVPAVSDSGETAKLTHFPNQVTIDAVEAATKTLKQNADQTLAFMVGLNRTGHDLLEPGSLPLPIDSNQSYRFRAQYNAVMDYGGKPEPWDRRNPDAGPYNLLSFLNATPVATQQEVDEARKKKWESDYLPKVYTVNGQQINLPEIQAQFDKDTAGFDKDFHVTRASQFRVYCEANDLTRAPHLTPAETPSATDIWFAQMTLWVEQDVCQTIREMNKDVLLQKGQGIAQSPVKNLKWISISPDARMYVLGAAVSSAPGTPPTPAIDSSTKQHYETSPTGRVCNNLYDVVQFQVCAVVLPSHLAEFLERLRYQRLLTVTSMSVEDVDWKAAEQLGYIYGPARCVLVTLDCEELFMRDWTVRQIAPDPNHPAPMPLDVQTKTLGITPDAPATPTPGKVALQ
jgi:hypothetical protein